MDFGFFYFSSANETSWRIRPALNASELTAYLTNTNPPDGLGNLAGKDIIELEPNTDYSTASSFTIPVVGSASADNPIIIRTRDYGNGSWPANGTKVTSAHASLMATLKNSSVNSTSPILKFADGAHHVYVHGIRIQGVSTARTWVGSGDSLFIGGLVQFSSGWSASQGSPTTGNDIVFPHHITFRHLLCVGDSTYGGGFGWNMLACDDFAAYDCNVYDLFTEDLEYQTVAIASGHRMLFQNCRFYGGCETFFAGGGVRYPTFNDDAQDYEKFQPKDITLRYCTLGKDDAQYYRSTAWAEQSGSDGRTDASNRKIFDTAGSYSFQASDVGKWIFIKSYDGAYTSCFKIASVADGKATTVTDMQTTGQTGLIWRLGRYKFFKNIFESKTCDSVTLDGCILENFYLCDQNFPIVFSAIDQTGSTGNDNPWVTITNVTVQKSILRNCVNVVNAPGLYTSIFGSDKVNTKGSGILFQDVLVYNHDAVKYGIGSTGGNWALQLNAFNNVKFERLTLWCDSTSSYPMLQSISANWTDVTYESGVCAGFILKDSIIYPSLYGPRQDSGPSGHSSGELWTGLFASTTFGTSPDWECHHNCFPNSDTSNFWVDEETPADTKWPPPGATYANLGSAAGYTVSAMESTHFENVATSDYRLKSGSALRTAGSTGGIVGADVAAINTAIGNIL